MYYDSEAVLRNRGGWAEDLTLMRTSPPFGPRNALSSIAYPIAGLYGGFSVGGEHGAAFFAAMWMLGLGSFLYHWNKTLKDNSLDWVGMYAVMTVIVCHSLWPNAEAFLLGAGMMAGMLGAMFAFESKRFDSHMGIGLAIAATAKIAHGFTLGTVASLALFATGYLAWHLDKKRVHLGIWGHALWHVLTAAAMATMFVL